MRVASRRTGVRPPALDVSVAFAGDRKALAARTVRRIVHYVLKRERVAGAEITVTFLSTNRMRALNRRTFGRDRTTDVIAFPTPHPDCLVGDVYVCPATARRSAHRPRSSGRTGPGGLGHVACARAVRDGVTRESAVNPGALEFVSVLIALMTTTWAGLLALAEESPHVSRALGDNLKEGHESARLYRTVHVGRISLLFIAGVAAAGAVVWWDRAWLPRVGAAAVAGGFLYMLAEALPRAVGALAPDVSAAAASVAARSAVPFRPLLGLVNIVERLAHRVPAGFGRDDQPVGSVERDLLLGVFSLSDTTVAEVMTPRLDIVAVDSDAEWSEAVDIVRRGDHARLPVYRETLDGISGILYAKDLVAAVAGVTPPPGRWQDLVRPVQFVPESKSLTAQLRDFQRGPAHLAVVVDEFGGTSGLVTLEDTLEEVVGEIHDEYDAHEEPAVEREGDHRFWVDGSLNLDELSALLGTAIDIEDVSTVGGFVYAELGHVPRPGEEFRFGSFRIVVEQVVRRRIRRVYFERLDVQVGAEEVEEE